MSRVTAIAVAGGWMLLAIVGVVTTAPERDDTTVTSILAMIGIIHPYSSKLATTTAKSNTLDTLNAMTVIKYSMSVA